MTQDDAIQAMTGKYHVAQLRAEALVRRAMSTPDRGVQIRRGLHITAALTGSRHGPDGKWMFTFSGSSA